MWGLHINALSFCKAIFRPVSAALNAALRVSPVKWVLINTFLFLHFVIHPARVVQMGWVVLVSACLTLPLTSQGDKLCIVQIILLL